MKENLFSLILLGMVLSAAAAALAAAQLPPAAPPPPRSPIAASERAIERRMLGADPSGRDAAVVTAAIDSAVAPLAGIAATTPGEASAILYTRGFAEYAKTVPLLFAHDQAGAKACFERAIALLQQVRQPPWKGEAMAIEGSIDGQLIGIEGGFAGISLGPKSQKLLAAAMKSLPRSPRVLVFQGLALWSTPAAFGGDKEEAAELMAAAPATFAAEDSRSEGPHWGRAFALGQLGYVRLRNGDLVGARAALTEALATDPEYAYLRLRLLPALARRETAAPQASR
jgi:hypothetical protein